MPRYVPIMVDCEGLPIVVIGGGRIAARKSKPLIEAGAVLTIISPKLCEELEQRHASGAFRWVKRPYRIGDIAEAGAGLVYACTNEKTANLEAAAEAKSLNIPVNVATSAEQGSFISPNVIRRGDLVISVSASGAGPAASRRIAEDLESVFGPEYERYVSFLRTVRERVKAAVEDADKRRLLLGKLAELDILEQIRAGRFSPWTEEQIDEWIVKG
ncbi:precorrin-2 dehydrogenase/sirohydrochlorin ferrochelatase family protein [Paenibacillus caui]|uniref:precorrin-2 dehydrogenase/sirohydrochlorin ferrochelatase family protein n=1 Tax=Paenibacillus caui TaxID=2873927 RepID=UPI001CA8EE2F|nr:NAD(P)-dependent oxidoreductase [Paenibacillus caui]